MCPKLEVSSIPHDFWGKNYFIIVVGAASFMQLQGSLLKIKNVTQLCEKDVITLMWSVVLRSWKICRMQYLASWEKVGESYDSYAECLHDGNVSDVTALQDGSMSEGFFVVIAIVSGKFDNCLLIKWFCSISQSVKESLNHCWICQIERIRHIPNIRIKDQKFQFSTQAVLPLSGKFPKKWPGFQMFHQSGPTLSGYRF